MKWFQTWFNSPYYHILYNHRDENEAQIFIENLTTQIPFSKDLPILDLACGKGRHSKILHQLGYDVLGIDLSENSISEAQQFQNKGLTFQVGDMREVVCENCFGGVCNLFTSFGYFDDTTENLQVLKSVYKELHPGGYFVLDYLNAAYVVQHLIENEIIEKEGVEFQIHRHADADFIYKDITFQTPNGTENHQEKVQRLSQKQLVEYITEAGMTVLQTWGNYNLDTFDEKSSTRTIILAQK